MQRIHISLADQCLRLYQNQHLHAKYAVSTALNGPGQLRDSACTPTGKHKIRLKIGGHCPLNTVFVGRRPTGECYSSELARQAPDRDWILTRILWLTGCESGYNRGGNCDSLHRFIYIHGTPDTEPMGVPMSHGCIRMRNQDIVELYDQVSRQTEVSITIG
jgi:L,D-transpeptidase YbiS